MCVACYYSELNMWYMGIFGLHVGTCYSSVVYVRYMDILEAACYYMGFGKNTCTLPDIEITLRLLHDYLISVGYRLHQTLSFRVISTEKSRCTFLRTAAGTQGGVGIRKATVLRVWCKGCRGRIIFNTPSIRRTVALTRSGVTARIALKPL